MKYCTKCTSVALSAAPLNFDDDGVCSGCRVAGQIDQIDWDRRWKMLERLVEPYRGKGDYDMLIPVSGGKDSYFQADIATRRLGLKVLLVTYHGNNYFAEGQRNLDRMRHVFNCDHLVVSPSVDTLVKMNRLGFFLQGDMNWHNHCGIFTTPIQIAVRHRVPLMLWGEHGFMDLAGMFSYRDFPEFTAKFRLEHAQRGYDWHDFTDEGLKKLDRADLCEGLTGRDLSWAQYPTDDEIDDVGVRGIYLSNYLRWDGHAAAEDMVTRYDWQPAVEPFQRTYRRFSNLDDVHENGAHDYLKFIKIGYGRGTDHSTKDIRGGRMTRDEGIEMVRQYDHVRPTRDLSRWLNYCGVTEETFDRTCDGFRDPRVWAAEDGRWVKQNIWGDRSDYGPVTDPAAAARCVRTSAA